MQRQEPVHRTYHRKEEKGNTIQGQKPGIRGRDGDEITNAYK